MFRKLLFFLCLFFISSNAFAGFNYTPKSLYSDYVNISRISSQYNIHPIMVMGIGYKESFLEKYPMNISSFRKTVGLSDFYHFINNLGGIMNSANSYMVKKKLPGWRSGTKIKYTLMHRKSGKYKTSGIINLNIKNIDSTYTNIRKAYKKLKGYSSSRYVVKFKMTNALGLYFENYGTVVTAATEMLKYTKIIDMGMTQVNYGYWLEPMKITPSKIYWRNESVKVSASILAKLSKRYSTPFDVIKHYHNAGPRGTAYAKSVSNHIAKFAKILKPML